MPDLQASLERIKDRQHSFRELKIQNLLHEKQEDSDHYINSLNTKETCQYMTGITGIINLCNNPLACKFKGEVYKSFAATAKKECLRERALKFERILEH
ncbi:MAG: hypothetical protein KKC75_01290 [Nanoarchaeota archaeon]|nr:hypothetical protein [Nanoarchaeota archaeon]MBU1004411.1 hypothetical protein [Nanoarchaeota archaeon]MBU1946702.1 hypothetical protein [Nanoarchaeota archaeon]